MLYIDTFYQARTYVRRHNKTRVYEIFVIPYIADVKLQKKSFKSSNIISTTASVLWSLTNGSSTCTLTFNSQALWLVPFRADECICDVCVFSPFLLFS